MTDNVLPSQSWGQEEKREEKKEKSYKKAIIIALVTFLTAWFVTGTLFVQSLPRHPGIMESIMISGIALGGCLVALGGITLLSHAIISGVRGFFSRNNLY